MCGLVLCGIILVSAGAAWYVIKACANSDKCPAGKTLVLWKDHYDDAWVAIATNHVLVSTNKVEVFRELMHDSEGACRFRIQILP